MRGDAQNTCTHRTPMPSAWVLITPGLQCPGRNSDESSNSNGSNECDGKSTYIQSSGPGIRSE